jgi:hypothetical protein
MLASTRFLAPAAVVLLALAGCADPALTQVSPNQYRIVKSDKLHFYRSTAELKADAVKEANDYAAARGKVALPIASSEQPLVAGVEFATVKYVFRMVDKGDPEARRNVSVAVQNLVLDKAEAPAATAASAAPAVAEAQPIKP